MTLRRRRRSATGTRAGEARWRHLSPAAPTRSNRQTHASEMVLVMLSPVDPAVVEALWKERVTGTREEKRGGEARISQPSWTGRSKGRAPRATHIVCIGFVGGWVWKCVRVRASEVKEKERRARRERREPASLPHRSGAIVPQRTNQQDKRCKPGDVIEPNLGAIST